MTETATGQRALAATSGVAHTTIGRILAGTVLCDIGSWPAWNRPWADGCGPNVTTCKAAPAPSTERPPERRVASDT